MSTRVTLEEDGQSGPGAELRILVMSTDTFAQLPLPAAGSVIIGRSGRCEVQIDDALASRRHARLHLEPELAIEDLGSSNGTRVRETVLEPGERVPVSVGEAIRIGSTVLLVERSSGKTTTRRLWSHVHFERLLKDACIRAETGDRFALVRMHLRRPAVWPRLVPLLARDVEPPHLFAAYGPNEIELLLMTSSQPDVSRITGMVETSLANIDVPVNVAVVWYPRDGRSAEALLGRANELLRPLAASRLEPTVPSSPAMRLPYEHAARAARADINVLILGQTGVGKEVMAQMIHRLSPRADRAFVAINSAGLPESLMESELFGHEKGAFTGAVQAKKGLLAAADGGTVFFDEIGDMPPAVQARLLRAIETREVLPVGAIKPQRIDVRFVAATHRDLEADVRSGTFREDLFYRLNQITIVIPPLAQRREEIAPLARSFVAQRGGDRISFSDAAMAALERHSWPGNIRELKNVVERAVVLCEGETIGLEHLPGHWTGPKGAATLRRVMVVPPDLGPRELEERKRMLEALEVCLWNQTKAAKYMQMARRTFVAKVVRYGIPRPQDIEAADDLEADEVI